MEGQSRFVIDQNGKLYKSIREFCRVNDISRSYLQEKMAKDGCYIGKKNSISLRYATPEEIYEKYKSDAKIGQEDKIEKEHALTPEMKKEKKMFDKLKEHYSEQELILLSKGQGLQDPNLKFPKICFAGGHHKIGVMSDSHLGSKYAPLEFHYEAFRQFEKEHCECILHCGDVVDGLAPRRAATQIYEQTHIGYRQQKELAVEVFSKCKIPIYVISGNHDSWYQEMGANIVEDICSEVHNMTYLGHNQADIQIGDAVVRLFHGGDGSPKTRGYRIQSIIESYTSGKKPNILLAGHVHKFCYMFERMIHGVSIPALQMQTPFMQGKKLVAHTGFVIIEFDTNENGVCNFSVKLFPFYA